MQYLETILVKNRTAPLIDYHVARMQKCVGSSHDLMQRLSSVVAQLPQNEFDYKYRIRYAKTGIIQEEITRYVRRPITSLRIVCDDSIDYSWKYADRSALDRLWQLRGEQDEILIVKQGLITDTSFSNVVFETFGGEMITPSSPLLKGVCRSALLDRTVITESPVTIDDLPAFRTLRLINALNGIDHYTIPIEQIIHTQRL